MAGLAAISKRMFLHLPEGTRLTAEFKGHGGGTQLIEGVTHMQGLGLIQPHRLQALLDSDTEPYINVRWDAVTELGSGASYNSFNPNHTVFWHKAVAVYVSDRVFISLGKTVREQKKESERKQIEADIARARTALDDATARLRNLDI